jgi:predicted HTH transcriptional regulator
MQFVFGEKDEESNSTMKKDELLRLIALGEGQTGSVKSSVKIVELIRKDKQVTIPAMAENLGLTTRAIEKQIGKLQSDGIIRRVGPDKGGYWEVVGK